MSAVRSGLARNDNRVAAALKTEKRMDQITERAKTHAAGPRGLMLAVLASAIEDYHRGSPEEQEEAAAWFAGYSAAITFRECADILGFDREWLRAMIRRRLGSGPAVRQMGNSALFPCGHPRDFSNSRLVEKRRHIIKPHLMPGQEIHFAYTANMILRGRVIKTTKHRVTLEAMEGERRTIYVHWEQIPGTTITNAGARRAICRTCYETRREAAKIGAGRAVCGTNGAEHNHHKGAMFPLWQADM